MTFPSSLMASVINLDDFSIELDGFGHQP